MKRPQRRLPDTTKSKQTSSDGAQARSAEVISFRPQKRETGEPKRPSRSLDDLPLEEVCEGWSRVTKRNPDILKAAIFAAFWRGLFETGEVPEIFQWVKPDDPEGGPSYLNSTNGVYEVAKDGSRHFTARREKLTWSRRDLYRARVCGEEGSDDEITALAFRPLNSYPPDFLNIWLPILHIAREDFARWYAEASLSAGAPLDSFWPARGTSHLTDKVDRRGPAGRRSPQFGPQSRKILSAYQAALAAGVPGSELLASAADLMRGTGPFLEGRKDNQPDAATFRRVWKRLQNENPTT